TATAPSQSDSRRSNRAFMASVRTASGEAPKVPAQSAGCGSFIASSVGGTACFIRMVTQLSRQPYTRPSRQTDGIAPGSPGAFAQTLQNRTGACFAKGAAKLACDVHKGWPAKTPTQGADMDVPYKTLEEILAGKPPGGFGVSPDTSVLNALQIMAEKGVGLLLVLEDNKLAG